MARQALVVGSLGLLVGGCITTPCPPPPPPSGPFATFSSPHGVAIEAGLGNSGADIIYVADYQSVRKIQGPNVTTLAGPSDPSPAGNQCPAGYVNGTGSAARFNYITSIVRNPATGDLYVTEHSNNAVRRITPAGVVTTMAGQGPGTPPQPSVDGIGTAASFHQPTGITVDPTGTYLYVADSYDYSIRRITVATQQVETVIGGQYIFPSVPSAVRLSNPTGLWFQPGAPDRLYVVDQGYGRIRYFDPAIYAGSPLSPAVMSIMPSGITFSLNHPAGIAVDPGNIIYLTEGNGGPQPNHIRRGLVGGGSYPIVAGGTPSGDSGTVPIGLNARFNTPSGIGLSPHNVLYVADQRNHRIKQMGISASYPVDVRAGHEPGNPPGCRDGLA
jgi:hypothetical protein